MNLQKEIIDLLESTGREGVKELIEYMVEVDFFTAPASTQFHGAYPGALAEHSFNVYQAADAMAAMLLGPDKYKDIENSIIICSILHDLGKCGQFGQPLYTPNILKSGKPSETKPFERNKELLTLPHEVVSCIEVTKFIDLTPEEQNAIAWHNGLYGAFKYDIQGKETPLYMIIHFADMWASRVVESKNKGDETNE